MPTIISTLSKPSKAWGYSPAMMMAMPIRMMGANSTSSVYVMMFPFRKGQRCRRQPEQYAPAHCANAA